MSNEKQIEQEIQDKVLELESEDDMVLVPRGLLGSARHAISNKSDAPVTGNLLKYYIRQPKSNIVSK